MSLNTVVEDIREEARTRAEEIRERAEEEAEAIIAEAEREAEAIVADRERAVERDIDQEREQRLSSAKLEAKQRRLETKRAILADVRKSVEDELASLSGDRRGDLTRPLLEDALDEFDTDAPVRIHGRTSDVDLLEELITDVAHDAAVVGDLDCLGGVVVESDSSRIRVDNTFDSVLEDVWSESLKDVSERLFDNR